MRFPSLLFFCIALSYFAHGQTCLSGGITFASQADIDNFSSNYPGCTEILGLTLIKESSSGAITNLLGLSQLQEVDDLIIGFNTALASLQGLQNIITVNGDLDLNANTALTSLDGLDNVTQVSGHFYLAFSNAMTSLTGLENLTSVVQYVDLSFNPALIDLGGLSGLTSISGPLIIYNNDDLVSLNGLENLTSIDGYVQLIHNDDLTDISGITNIDPGSIHPITTNEAIQIQSNPLLSMCEVQSICDALALSSSTTDIHSNSSGCNSEAEVQSACDAVLPVIWSTPLTATLRQNTVQLHWSVSQQKNNEGFWIEWSNDGREFKRLDFIHGQGDYPFEMDYSYQHRYPSKGDNYYRIRQIDFNGNYSFSNTAHENLISSYFTISPNPMRSELTISTSHPDIGRIANAQGQVLLEFDLAQEASNIDVSALPPGIYFLETKSGHAEKLIKH